MKTWILTLIAAALERIAIAIGRRYIPPEEREVDVAWPDLTCARCMQPIETSRCITGHTHADIDADGNTRALMFVRLTGPHGALCPQCDRGLIRWFNALRPAPTEPNGTVTRRGVV